LPKQAAKGVPHRELLDAVWRSAVVAQQALPVRAGVPLLSAGPRGVLSG
jgi:hypothetical protein